MHDHFVTQFRAFRRLEVSNEGVIAGLRIGAAARKWRLAAIALVCLCAVATTFALCDLLLRRPAEPVYQGRSLSQWLADCRDSGFEPDAELTPAERERHERAVEAVRQIGPAGLPCLLRMLERSSRAITGFQILGPQAAPAIPKLLDLLRRDSHGEAAQMCLSYIGRDAVPGLRRLLTNSAPKVQREALLTLGNLGAAAGPVAPLVAEIALNTNHPNSGISLSVLAEIEPDPARYVSVFSNRLANPRFQTDAAFALARSGSEGIPPLLAALGDDRSPMRALVCLALNPEFVSDPADRRTNPPSPKFHSLRYRFDLDLNYRASQLKGDRANGLAALRLSEIFQQRDPAVRVLITDALGRYGLEAAPGLGRALADGDGNVRQHARAVVEKLGFEIRDGAISRGLKTAKRLALVFTGHEFAEGGPTILDQLAGHKAKGSFFLTGDFLRNTNFNPIVRRIVEEGHYLGPHSDKHLLYCSWDDPRKTLLSSEEFGQDLTRNHSEIMDRTFPVPFRPPLICGYFLPAYEHCNPEIAERAWNFYFRTVNYTPGTRSAADYTGEADKNFVSSRTILDSIIAREQQDPNGLNGFLLLLHIGAGPGRADKFHPHFGELLDFLATKGCELVRVDELLENRKVNGPAPEYRPKMSRDQKEVSAAIRKRYGLERTTPADKGGR